MAFQVEEEINQLVSHSLSRPVQQEESDVFFHTMNFLCEKIDQGYSEAFIDEFMSEGLSNKKFKKYLMKKMAKDAEFDERLRDEQPNFDYLFEKYVEFKRKKSNGF